jgi:hypothetical protein
MKKLVIAMSCIAGMVAYFYGPGLGMSDSTEAKKVVCEKACVAPYETCLKAAQKVTEKITDPKKADAKKKAEEAICKKAKELCEKKCAPAQTEKAK